MSQRAFNAISGIILATAFGACAAADIAMQQTASGEFEVKLTPFASAEAKVGSLEIKKTFSGDLTATSSGQMLAVRTPVENSAGYVAMELVNGSLAGRSGTFALQHSGTMNHGAQSLSVTVVPDSATGELAGLSGSMQIKIEGGKHYYTFTYALPR
jgi:hypothetical protein